ncbi:ribosome biogenesis protein Nsa1p [Monosporozyma unispora]|nr:Ribosome biogenesis protein nsa1 (NOP7-associated protein 1) [Kazachstania unispora]
MRFLIGCPENGSIKEIICNIETDSSKKDSIQPFHSENSISEGSNNKIDLWYSLKNDKGKMIISRNNGVLQLVNRKDELKEVEEKQIKYNVSQFEMLDFINEDDLLSNKRLEPLFAKSKKRTKLLDAFICISPLNKEETKYLIGTKSGLIHIVELNDTFTKISKTISHEVRAPLEFIQLYDNEESKDGDYIFALGGEENLVKLFKLSSDFQTVKQFWEAKNVKNDRLDMRVPVWPMALKFLNPIADAKEKDKINYQFVTITRFSHLGVYQTQHGKKPLHYIDILPNRDPLTSLEFVADAELITPSGNLKSSDIDNFTFITTDTRKDVLKYTNKGRLLGKYGKSDIVGAVNYIKNISGDKYLIEVGLDRYLRVFDINSLKTLIKVYVGAKAHFVELLDDEDVELPQPISKNPKKRSKQAILEEAEKDEDPEALWDELEKGPKKAKKSKQ